MNKIVLGGGCFWCMEAFLVGLRGVVSVVPGYAGGTTDNPNYEQVCAGIGNHAEVVEITYDSQLLPLTKLLEVFFAAHDPTTLNRQGHDEGPQYRSCIFYEDESERLTIDEALIAAQTVWDEPIVTEIAPLLAFYEAEGYHHNYFQNNPNKAYCQIVINPKLRSIRQSFGSLMK
jgi:peptide-methionine (S)-S-oxide reductase